MIGGCVAGRCVYENYCQKGEGAMKTAMVLLTILMFVGLITGVGLVISGNVAAAGVAWAVTLLLSCAARRVEMYRVKKAEENR